jgi:hypothetical protein
LKTKEWNPNDYPCNCSNSIHCDSTHKHIVTGNLSVIKNAKLRSLLTKGPSYRESNAINWIKVFQQIKKGVDDCQKTWCKKEQVDPRVLSEWKNRLLHEVKIKIESLRNNYSHTPPKKVLDDEIVKRYLRFPRIICNYSN